jgi:L-fuconolactonase
MGEPPFVGRSSIAVRIDSHQHFWNYEAAQYGWITPGTPLHRDYVPADLKGELQAARIDGCIAVQARQELEENRYLTDLAAHNSFILGVVGWIDLRSEMVAQQAAEFRRMPKAVGVRHVVQGESDPDFMARPAFRKGIAALAEHNLVYDILIHEHQLPDAVALVRDCPNQKFVIDHIAKPRIRENSVASWHRHLTEIAHYPNVMVKLSGMVTEADHKNWSEKQLRPYWEQTLQTFGASRTLFGSDWPVIRLACEYQRWVEVVENWLTQCSSQEREQIMGLNAKKLYLQS